MCSDAMNVPGKSGKIESAARVKARVVMLATGRTTGGK